MRSGTDLCICSIFRVVIYRSVMDEQTSSALLEQIGVRHSSCSETSMCVDADRTQSVEVHAWFKVRDSESTM